LDSQEALADFGFNLINADQSNWRTLGRARGCRADKSGTLWLSCPAFKVMQLQRS